MSTANLETLSTIDIIKILDEQLVIHKDEEYRPRAIILYNVLNHHLNERKLSQKELTNIVEKLKERSVEELVGAGFIISALTNFTDQEKEKIVIDTRGFAKTIDYLALENEKLIKIKGDVGDFLGAENRSDILLIGNAGRNLGDGMTAGMIEQYGNSRNYVGRNMHGGSIYIHGEAGEYCGHSMKSGYIELFSHAGELSGFKMRGGNLTIHGNATDVGRNMECGLITIYGNAEGITGEFMMGGRIIVNGRIKSIAYSIRNGAIDQGTKKIVSKGKMRWFTGISRV